MHSLEIKVARIFNTYGPRMSFADGRVISNFIVQALRGEDITVYGTGSQTRSFCYVSDLVDGLVLLMNSGKEITGPINLGNPGEKSMKEIAELVVGMTGSASKLVYQDLPIDDPRRRCPDISRAKSMLGWQPEVSLEDGLRRTIADFESRLQAIKQVQS
jgi:UDP-glucuronate decarboxylase